MHHIFLVLPRNPICNVPGECSGSTLVGLTFPQNVKECLKDCKDNKECLYFTYHEDGKKYCNQFDGCEIFATNCTKCWSGEVSCPYEVEVEVDNPEVDNPEVDNSEVDNPEVDNLNVNYSEVDNPLLDNQYKCNLTGICQVSYKHKSHKHNINAQIS